MKHTSGPWRIVKGLWGTSEGWPIAQVGDGIKIASGPMHSDSVGAAEDDARLIAAAPEMLEALKTAWQALHEVPQCTSTACACWTCEARKFVTYAITKAEGV